MKKKLLAALPVKECSESEIAEARRTGKEIKWLIRYSRHVIDRKKTLVLYLYRKELVVKGKKTPEFRVFITMSDYIIQDFFTDPCTWKPSSLERLKLERYWKKATGQYYTYEKCLEDCSHIIGDDSIKSIEKFFGKEDASLYDIYFLQDAILEKRKYARHKREMDRIDKRMEDVPALPKDFKKWLRNEVMYYSRYIFYKYQKGKKKMEGYCVHCKHDVLVTEPRHRTRGKCPRCHSEVTFLSRGKSKSVLDGKRAALIQKTPDGIVLRYFRVYCDFRDNYRQPELTYSEYARDFFISGSEKYELYWMANFKQTNIYRWCVNPDTPSYYYTSLPATAVLYPKNLAEALRDTEWYNCGIDAMAAKYHAHFFNVWRYIWYFKDKPQIKFAAKAGLTNIIHDYLVSCGANCLDWNANKLQAFLNLDDYYARMIVRVDGGVSMVEFTQELLKRGIRLSDEDIVFAVRNAGTRMLDRLPRFHIARKINYIRRQAALLKMKPRDVEHDWCDYLGFCTELKMDLSNPHVAFPKNMKKAHDRTYKQLQEFWEETKRKEMEKMHRTANGVMKQFGNSLNWEDKKYLIRLPHDSQEIIKEGEALDSCVGRYTKHVANRSSLILFLRKKGEEENPYFTLQLKDGEIVQARGKASGRLQASPTPEIKKAITDYTKTLPGRAEIYDKIMNAKKNARRKKAA